MSVKAQIRSNIQVLDFMKEVLKDVKDGIQEYQTTTVAQMKAKAPVDEGTLRDNIYGQISDNGLTSTIVADTYYAAYQEFGTIQRYDSAYATKNDVDQYALQFKVYGPKQPSGGTPAKRYFFGPARANFIALIDKLNKG